MSKYMTEEERAKQPAFAAFAPCGHIVACAVDSPEYARDNAKSVAQWMRDGLRIEKMAVEAVRSGPWCSCEREKKKRVRKTAAPLFEKVNA